MIDTVVFDKGRVFLVKADRQIQACRLFHCLIEEGCAADRDPVVCETACPAVSQFLHICEFLAFQRARDGSGLVDADFFLFGATADIQQRLDIINDRRSVGHTDDGSKSALCGRKSPGVQIFFVGESGVTEVYVCVDKSGCGDETGCIYHLFRSIGCDLSCNPADEAVFYPEICFLCRL